MTTRLAETSTSPGRMARRWLPAVLLAAGLAMALAAGLMARARPQARAAATALAGAMEARLRAEAVALRDRLGTLSALPRLAAAVATDEELALEPRPGETIVIGQRLRGGGGVVLLTLPRGTPAEPLPRDGDETSLRGDRLRLRRTVTVVPRDRAGEIVGVLAVSRPVALPELDGAAATGARLELDGRSVGPAPAAATAGPVHEVVADVRLPGGRVARLRLPAAAPVRAPAIALLLAGALLLAAAGRVPRRTGARPAPRARPRTPVRPTPAEAASARAFSLAETARTTPRPAGLCIGRYQFVGSLGRGGMAEVLLARALGEAGFGRLVAIKVLRRELGRDPALVTSFLDEARLAASLNHPHIVQIHDLGRAGDQYYIAMEFIDGGDLARLISAVGARGAPVPLPIAIAILRRICDGLHAAHTASGPDGQPLQLIHRDVKAANVLVSRAGEVKVGDFGVAKTSHALRRGRSAIGEIKGTPGYMAPETRLGRAVDQRVDVYGVGAIAYELITGEPLYLELLTPSRTADDGTPLLRPISTFRCVPGDVEAAVTRALAVDPARRFGDCAQVERALAALAARHGVADDKQIGRWAQSALDTTAPCAPAAR